MEGNELPHLLDTCAQISVMPDELIPSAARTGDKVRVKGFNGVAELRDIAVTKIKIRDKEFEEKVALAKLEELEGKGILALNLREKDSWDIMNMMSERGKRVGEVETRAMVKERKENDTRQENSELKEERVVVKPMGVSKEDKDEELENGLDAQKKVVEQSASVDVAAVGDKASEVGDEAVEGESSEIAGLGQVDNVDAAVDLPCVQKGVDQQKLIEETKEDCTLAICRALADKKEWGYFLEKGLLLSRQIDPFYGPIICIVLPASRRNFVLDIAHERTGHLGYRKVEMLTNSKLIWPFLSKEVSQNCASCQLCQKANKAGPHRVPMVNRPVITEIFEKNCCRYSWAIAKRKRGC